MPTHLRRNAVLFVLTMVMVLWSLPTAVAGPGEEPPPDPTVFDVTAACDGDQGQISITLAFPDTGPDVPIGVSAGVAVSYYVDTTYEGVRLFTTVDPVTVTVDAAAGIHLVDVVYQLEGSVTPARMSTSVDVPACDDGYGDPKKVWICHIAGHEAGGVFFESAIGELLDGDYVLTYKGEPTPTATQQAFCEDADHSAKLIPFEGKLKLVSVNSVKNGDVGHRVQNLERGIGSYPDGYKG